MQENQNDSRYVDYNAYEPFRINSVPNNYVSNSNVPQSRSGELCFAFGIVSLCMLMGNAIAGLIFGILSMVFHKKALKEGIQSKNVTEGRTMGLIGVIINGIFVGFGILYVVFIMVSVILSFMMV